MTSRDKEYPNTAEKDKHERVKLDKIMLDVGYLNDTKIITLCAEFGAISALYLISCYCALAGETRKSIKGQLLESLGSHLGVTRDSCREILTRCVDLELLYSDADGFFHPRIIDDQIKIASQRNSWRKRQEKSRVTHAGVTQRVLEPEPEPDPDLEPDLKTIKKKIAPPKIQKIEVEPDVWLSEAELKASQIAHGAPQTTEMLKSISDYQLSTGKRYKDHAAVLRQWFRRDAERKTSPPSNGYRPHTAAAMAEKNLAYFEKKYGPQNLIGLFDPPNDSQKKLGTELHDGRGLVSEPTKPK